MNKKVVIGISAAIVVIIVAVLVVMNFMGKGPAILPGAQESQAKALFYDSLGNAAGQGKIRVAMYRATYVNAEDADAKKNTGSETSSVAEVDIATGKSRSVYATNNDSQATPPEFKIGRCMDGTAYQDDYAIENTPRPKTLLEAAETLKTNQHLYKSTVPLFIPCPNVGPITGAAVDLAAFRVSDGVFPVTLSTERAAAWKEQVQKADLFTIKDEGAIDWNGKQVKKVSFTPKEQDGVNRSLYEIYYNAADIEKIKAEVKNAIYEYELITMNPANTGSVGGYYLIDEKTKLPVYSELYGTNTSHGNSRFNVARSKQSYQFGQPLSLSVQAPLELLP